MKKSIVHFVYFLPLFLILIPTISFSQKSTELEFKFEKTIIIKEKYPEKDIASDFEKIKLIVKRDSIPEFDFHYSVKLQHLTTSDKDVRLHTNHFVVSKDDFYKMGNEIVKEIIVEIYRDTIEIDKSDEVFELILVPNTSSFIQPFTLKQPEKMTVTITDAQKPADTENPFRITTGANFDFDKTLKASLYFDAQLYKPILFPCSNNDNFGLGVYSSLYNSRYVASDSIQDNKVFNDVLGTGDTIDLVRYNYEIGRSNSIKNIGGEIGLLASFQSKISKDTEVSFSLLLPEFGAISRNITTTYKYEKINQDTLFNIQRPDTIHRLIEREFVSTRYHDIMFGTGLIFRLKSKSYGEFMMKFSTGLNHTYFPDFMLKRGYYDFRFQLLDPKVGINLGGQIRGNYGNGAPYFSVYLSKSFSLTKLTEY